MIIETISFHNFGVFKGKHSINLAPSSKKKHIVLFGGLNGAGKTTILEAMLICLYGRSAPTDRRGIRSYENYLKSLINRDVKLSDGAMVELAFRVVEEGKKKQYIVKRSWSSRKGKISEYVDVFIDGIEDFVLSEAWNEQVERILPARLSHLFFFDGERIEALADPDQTERMLSSAMYSLLGIDLVEQLISDLKGISQKKIKEIASDADKKAVDELEVELRTIVQQRKSCIGEKTKLEYQINQSRKVLERADAIFSEKGGGLAQERHQLEKEKVVLEEQLRLVKEELVAISFGSLPLTLVSDLLNDVMVQVKLETESVKAGELLRVIRDYSKRITIQLNKAKVDVKVLKKVKELYENEKHKYDRKDVECYLNSNTTIELRLSSLVAGELDTEVKKGHQIYEKAKKIGYQLDQIRKKIAFVPDEGSITDIIKEREKAKVEHRGHLLKMEELNTSIVVLEEKRKSLVKGIDGILRANKLLDYQNDEITRFIGHADSTVDILDNFKQIVLMRNARRLEKDILNSFKKLLRKKSLIHDIRIHADGGSLRLFDKKGMELSSDRFSAGERQLLALSILWGLGKASGRTLPVVIDTPLGRLDASHRKNLVEYYFPKASHQVMIFSTDEEVDERHYKKLKDSIAHSYVIEHDDSMQCSVINSGYFWE